MTSAIDILVRLLEETRRLGADAADAVLFETIDLSRSRRMGKPEELERSESKALGLRAFIGQQSAMVSTTDMLPATLSELAGRAVAMAKAAPPDPDAGLAPPALYSKNPPELDLRDPEEPDSAWLAAQCEEAEEAALATSGITNSEGAQAHYGQSRIALAIAGEETFARQYETSHSSLSISVLAGTGTEMERDYEFTSARHHAELENAALIGEKAAERALRRLNPRKVETCRAPVIFDPRVSKNLLGILAGCISGAAVARGSSFLKDDLGKRLFPEGISIIDDPHIKGGLGSRPFDGEGVANRKMAIVENGTLSAWLLDLRTASKLKMRTTGHAARGVASPPSPSSTNFYMEKGKLSPTGLIRDIKSGLYLTETFGMGVNTTTGDYSQGASGFWIENGEIAYPVSEITIAGHLREMFAHLTPADDLAFRYATNAPTLRVEGMTIAGA